MVATAGALDVVFPDLPSPIAFSDGRAIHLNLSILWPIIRVIGGVYYFFPREAEKEIHSYPLALWQFWLTVAVSLTMLTTLAFGLNEGQEYFEAWWPLRAGLIIILALFFYNLLRTYLKKGVPKIRPTLVSMLIGVGTLIVLYLPNLFFQGHQTIDEAVSFWVIHLWEEMSLELVGTGVVIALLLTITKLKRGVLEAIIYLELALTVGTGFLSTGHHYYWIGFPRYWLWVGLFFSAGQLLPIGMLALAGVFGFLALGISLYIVTQRQVMKPWEEKGIWLTFVLLNGGLLLMGGALMLSGILQVYLWRVVGLEFSTTMRLVQPYLTMRVLGGMIYAGGSTLLTWLVIRIA